MELKIEYLPISALTPYERNTRKHGDKDVSNIAESIKKYGMNDAVGIWGEKNIIVEGHGRVLACKQLGIETVPCVRLDHLSDKERKEYAIAHNATAELSSWDLDALALELPDLEMGDFDFDFGFELDADETEAKEDDYDAEPPAEPYVKLGDIYQLGQHRLMCGDSTKLSDVEKLMDGMQADLLITDPPYNVNYEGATKDKLKIANDNMSDAAFRQFLVDAFTNANAVMKPGAVFYIWHADSEGYNFRGACRDAGWTVRQCLIWNKNSMVMGRQDYQWKHEPCLYGWKEGAGHLWASDRKQTTILNFEKPVRNDLHPTMKPVALFDYQIKNNTKGGDIVLDLFGGSGTTIMACEQNGRKAYSMEFDPRYAQVIIERWESFTGEKAVLVK